MAHAHTTHHGHIHHVPKATLFKVFGALVFLTLLTVAASRVHLGPLNVPVAIGIAVIKASLVVTFFMALKYDNKVNALVMMIGVIFVGVFLTFTLFDTAFRGDLSNVGAMTIADEQRMAAIATGEIEAPTGGHEANAETGEPATPGGHEAGAAAAMTEGAHAEAAPADTLDAVALLQTYMCTSCHAVDNPNVMVGPSLFDVGSRLTAEEIRQSILEPDAVIAENFPPGVMKGTLQASGFYDKVTPEELDAMVNYLAERKGE